MALANPRLYLNLLQRTLAALGLGTLLALAIYTPTTVAAEDAVILHLYSRNLAETGVISYIPGGPRAEGATDFLWMVYIAAGEKLHIGPGTSSAVANVLAALGIAWCMVHLAGKKATRLLILSVIGVLALFPQLQAALKGFAVLPFAFALVLTMILLLKGNDPAAALCALLLCLLRPDGVVFAIPAIILLRFSSPEMIARSLKIYGSLFVLPGLIYFLWRWRYFGELFPLPFLVKANEHRTLGLFITYSVITLAPFAIFAVVAVGALLGRRVFEWGNARLLLVLFVIPTLFYSNIRLEQNLNGRFFFYFPIDLAMLTALRWNEPCTCLRRPVLLTATSAGLLFFAYTSFDGFKGNLRARHERDRHRSMASDFNVPKLRGKMLTTEAGLFPYYSRWVAYDSWGLDTAEFARRIIQPEQVEKLHPDVAIIHLYFDGRDCRLVQRPSATTRDWRNMTDNVQTGLATLDDYDIWRVPYQSLESQRRPVDDLCFYVARSYGGRANVENILERYQGVMLAER